MNEVVEFAIVGHPNEGKSSVVSTLAEDDSVRISPMPGETIACRRFPVVIDGREIIGFMDTPGFQNPVRTLEWMRDYSGPDAAAITEFRKTHLEDPDFRDDCELFSPIADGAGIIYVVDGSRPLRSVDRAEMEVLRLTGRPRLAIINCKEEDTRFLDAWRNEFRKSFNAVRVFNAHRATYAERIDLLESLKRIDQDWQPSLEMVIETFKKDWRWRNEKSSEIICRMLEDALTYRLGCGLDDGGDETHLKEELSRKFNRNLIKMEKKAHQKIRGIYKHNIFNVDLPSHSLLHTDLFSEETWQFLGLTKKQLVTAAGLSGAALGATLDLAAHGLSFGVFSAIGGLAGVGWAAMGGAGKLARVRVAGMGLGGRRMQIGPVDNVQLLYVLIDRFLLFYSHIINWAHGRRDYHAAGIPEAGGKAGMTTEWREADRQVCLRFFKGIRSSDDEKAEKVRQKMNALLQGVLADISTGDRPKGE